MKSPENGETMLKPLLKTLIVVLSLSCLIPYASADVLPNGVKAVWDLTKAHKESSTTRESICINGLWQWQPAKGEKVIPQSNWGYFKVPGAWAGKSNYIFKETQTLYPHSSWKNTDMRSLDKAWYQRDFKVPASWKGRRILITAEMVNSFAAIYIDGKKAGAIQFPAGECDISKFVKPGKNHKLSVYMRALPLKAVMANFNDSASEKTVKGNILRRGLCGDVFLVSRPKIETINNTKIETLVDAGKITIRYTLKNLKAAKKYQIKIVVKDHGKIIKTFLSKKFGSSDIKESLYVVTKKWKPKKLWDLNTPQNLLTLESELKTSEGKTIDAPLSETFGFREFKSKGKDFYLNGSRILLSAMPVDLNLLGTYHSSYPGALESLKRKQAVGINLIYSHNYDSNPGAHFSNSELFRACDDSGMLMALALQQSRHYNWNDKKEVSAYKKLISYYVKSAQNHPSVVFYSMNHNALGYHNDMNPDAMNGDGAKYRGGWATNNAKVGYKASSLVRKLDTTRIIYHHAGGTAEGMHTSNNYLNMAPIQERSDWFATWSEKSNIPIFLVEYGIPLSWSFSMYRGWYKGKRNFGSANVPWELCNAEWSAQFVGDSAYDISAHEAKVLKWEAKQFKTQEGWRRWSYPGALGGNAYTKFDNRQDVQRMYIEDNLRSFRMLGVSAFCLWSLGDHWVTNKRPESIKFKTDWEKIQRPGFSPDFIKDFYMRFDLANSRKDWKPTSAGQAVIDNNGPLLAFIGGEKGSPTEKWHNIQAGKTINKQLVFFNNSRVTQTVSYEFQNGLGKTSKDSFSLKTGTLKYVEVNVVVPPKTRAKTLKLKLLAKFGKIKKTDNFDLHVLPKPKTVKSKIALFDPKGETATVLKQLRIPYKSIQAKSSLNGYDCVIIGKQALNVAGPGPDLTNLSKGIKVILMEQGPEVLEKRFGFRIQEYGLRRVFTRVAAHPILKGLSDKHLNNWRGSSSLLAPRRTGFFTKGNMEGLQKRNGLDVTRVFRCGTRGTVASVIIEKPQKGNFTSIVDGGFSLQYSPLLEYKEGKGIIIFNQLDLSGRDKTDAAAMAITRNLISYVSNWKPGPSNNCYYAGEAAGLNHLKAAGYKVTSYKGQALAKNDVLVLGPKSSGAIKPKLKTWVNSGGKVIGIGLSQVELNQLSSNPIKLKAAEYINSTFAPSKFGTMLAGIGPGELHLREPRILNLVVSGLNPKGKGALAVSNKGNLVLCQVVPWQFNLKQFNTRRVFRRSSYAIVRLLGNAGVDAITPIAARVTNKPQDNTPWLSSVYLDKPIVWDDPYRFFRW
ncbi:MAG: hypothetical protein MJH11_10645 [Lentisphaeria bacterium]|nr:hypothetical protein [Lentisphaeria bacterium]